MMTKCSLHLEDRSIHTSRCTKLRSWIVFFSGVIRKRCHHMLMSMQGEHAFYSPSDSAH